MTGLLINYLGRGLLANRPVTPDVADGALSLYYADDTTPPQMYTWNSTGMGSWDSIVTLDAPSDSDMYVRLNGDWVVLPAYPDVPDVPGVDGFVYGMVDGVWTRINVGDLADIDSSGLADGFILKYDLASMSWKVAAESGGGGGGGASIQELIHAARVKGYTTGFTNGSKIDTVVTKNDFVGLILHVYTDHGTGSYINGTGFTVPVGKIAIVLHAESSTQSGFFHSEIYNSTTATIAFNFGATQWVGSGAANISAFNSTIPYPAVIGVAGDVLFARCTSANDGAARTVFGEFIIAIVDPSNPSTFDPG